MIYDHRSDIHDSLPTVLLYACPNLNARYTGDRIKDTAWTGDYPECAVCGKPDPKCEVHHEPPRSKGSLSLKTPNGNFVVKPTLITLCKNCHGDRHSRGLLSFEWEFDDAESEASWLAGEFQKQGWQEHGKRYWDYGRLLVTSRGMTWEVRG